MGIKFADFSIRGIDVSSFNGVYDWNKAKANGVQFSAIRAGYGNTTDSKFSYNWEASSGKVLRFAYWYMDYYSNWYNKSSSAYGMSDIEWGKLQARNCWNLIKSEKNKIITFLDIESGGSSYSPSITSYPATTHAQNIAKEFLVELDKLSGLKNGIYCSLGLLTWFSQWFRDRPLWIAWYTDTQTPLTVIQAVVTRGWTGKVLMWQYASDGDVDDDGIGDGKKLGNGYPWIDLNGWIGSDKEYESFTNGSDSYEPEKPQVSIFKIKVLVNALNIRKCPSTSCKNVGRVEYNKTYDVYETSGNWMKIGDEQWVYGISSYVQKVIVAPPSKGKRPSRLEYPLPEGIRISQKFGQNPSWYPQSRGHNGIDWACVTGTPIYAMQEGVVIVSSEFSQAGITNGKIGYGRHVRIQHTEGVSIYGHLSKRMVKVGDRVVAGQQIGISGGSTSDPNSGFSTGAHLHAEYRVDGLSNPVPGGYEYNAFDFLPILVSKPLPEGITKWKVTATAGLKIRSAPNTFSKQTGIMSYDEQFTVSSIDNNNWGKLYNGLGYTYLGYAKKI